MTGGDKGCEGRKVGQEGVGRSRKASPGRWHLSSCLSQVRCEGGKSLGSSSSHSSQVLLCFMCLSPHNNPAIWVPFIIPFSNWGN